MSFVDLVFLKKTDINTDNNHIEYTRCKTKQAMNAYITAPMQQTMDYFATVTPEDSPYVFPFIDPQKGNEYKQYQTALSLQNRHLKTLQMMAGILKSITTHVARHTWATLAKWENIPIALISECLGHRDVKTTEIYLASFDNPAKKKVSEQISALIFHPKEDGKKKSAKGSSKKRKSPYNEGISDI
jgi:integrase